VTRSHDSGFATVWVVTSMTLVVAAAAVAMSYGAATLQRHRADAAADAVALVVALRALDGSAVACAYGADLARLNGAVVTRCDLQGSISQVSVEVRLPGPLAEFGPATARSRAGPTTLTPSTSR
jgi:secretion/DNA translocation related TadE-like protein